MDIINTIYNELSQLGFKKIDEMNLTEIRNKNGVHLYRIKSNNTSFVLKYFEKEEFKREISNYDLLRKLNIPTLKVFGTTDQSLLLEDLEANKDYRLGISTDMEDIEVAKGLARWYRTLHREGAKYLAANKESFYKESDSIKKEAIEQIKTSSNTDHHPVWNLILEHFDLLQEKMNSFEETLTYNDFYWTNFAVGHDKKKALMFDYNFLGCGFRYNDIRNVCSSLSHRAAEAFVDEYGPINEDEKNVDAVISILFDLIVAFQKPVFPNWSKESLDAVNNGKLEEVFKKAIGL